MWPRIRKSPRRRTPVANLALPNASQGPANKRKQRSCHQQPSHSYPQLHSRQATSTQHRHRNPPDRRNRHHQRTQVCHRQRRPTRASQADHRGNERSQHGYLTTRNIMTHSDKDKSRYPEIKGGCSDDVRIRIFAPKARLRDHATPSPHATKLCYDSLTSLYFLFLSVENLSPS